MKQLLNLIFVISILFGCEGNTAEKDAAKNETVKKSTTENSEDNKKEEQPSDPLVDNSLKYKDVVTISFALNNEEPESDDKYIIYTMKTDSSEIKEIGRVSHLVSGPLVIPSRDIFVFYGQPLKSDSTALYSQNYKTGKITHLIEPNLGIGALHAVDNDKAIMCMRGGHLLKYDFASKSYEHIYSLSASGGLKISPSGKSVLAKHGKNFVLYDLDTKKAQKWPTIAVKGNYNFSDDFNKITRFSGSRSELVFQIFAFDQQNNPIVLDSLMFKRSQFDIKPAHIIIPNVGNYFIGYNGFSSKLFKVSIKSSLHSIILDAGTQIRGLEFVKGFRDD